MDLTQLWKLTQAAWEPITAKYETAVEAKGKEDGLELRTWGLLVTVLCFEPEDITPGHLIVRGPYTSTDAYMDRLTHVAAQGFLEPTAPGAFRLSERGHALVNKYIDIAREEMVAADPFTPEESQRLSALFERLVQASMNTAPPPDTWCIRLSYKLMPASLPPLPYTEQAFSCLVAYRDDAHLAAWQRSGLSAMALETLTLLWSGEASSLDDLCNKLAHRGHDCRVYITVLEELRKAGYIHGPDQAPFMTGAGRVFRNQVEADTDRYFFTPWACLNNGEQKELAQLLTHMKAGLEANPE